MAKSPIGRLPANAIRQSMLPRLDPALLARYRALKDPTGSISDALDELGLIGALPASLLRPSDPAACIVGQALTVRNRPRAEPVAAAVAAKSNRLGEIEAHNLAEPGDVLVIQSEGMVSNMGGLSASIGKRQGEIGAVVDGAVRDIARSRALGYPIWSRHISPVTGKWRLETVEVNGPITIEGIRIAPGDLVVADEVGVCFVPFARAGDVLAVIERQAQNEAARQALIDQGTPLAEVEKARR